MKNKNYKLIQEHLIKKCRCIFNETKENRVNKKTLNRIY